MGSKNSFLPNAQRASVNSLPSGKSMAGNPSGVPLILKIALVPESPFYRKRAGLKPAMLGTNACLFLIGFTVEGTRRD